MGDVAEGLRELTDTRQINSSLASHDDRSSIDDITTTQCFVVPPPSLGGSSAQGAWAPGRGMIYRVLMELVEEPPYASYYHAEKIPRCFSLSHDLSVYLRIDFSETHLCVAALLRSLAAGPAIAESEGAQLGMDATDKVAIKHIAYFPVEEGRL